MTTNEIMEELSSPSWLAVSQAVEHAGDLLRNVKPTEAQGAAIGERMLALAADPKWEVRKAVAHALQYLRHETFNVALARLLRDDNPWVQNAAQRSQALRTELTRADVLQEQHGALLLQWLSDLESKHGVRARRRAMKVAENYAEMLFKEARHEINRAAAPLDTALMNIEDALGRPRIDRESALMYARRARERLRHLNAVADGLREFTKQITLKLTRENLRRILEETTGLVKGPAKDQPLAVKVRADAALVVEGDRTRLLQAFSNILQNAIESYEGENVGAIRIGARADGGHVVITFADEGCGMSEEAVSDAFHLFSTSKPGGTGVGLPLAKKIIETEHGGTIRLASKKGKGTTVTVVLPIKQAKRQE